jgi:hypothetical protein
VAVYEPTELISADSEPITGDDADLLAVAELFGLTLT